MSSSRVPLLVKSKGRKPSGLTIAPKKAPSAGVSTTLESSRVAPVSAPLTTNGVASRAPTVSRSPQKTTHVTVPSTNTRIEKPIAPLIRPTIPVRPRSIAPGNSIATRRSPLLHSGEPIRSPILRPGLTLIDHQPPVERLNKISSKSLSTSTRLNVEPRVDANTLTGSTSTSSPLLTGSQNPVIQRAIRKLDIKPNHSPRRQRTSSVSSPSTTPLVAAITAGAQAAAAAEDRQQQQEKKRAMSITSEDHHKPMEKKPSKEIVAMSTTSAKSNKTISNGARVSLKRNAKAKAITTYEENKYSDDQDEEVEYAVPARERATLWAKEVLRQQLGEDVEEDEDKETTQTVNKRLRSDSMVSFASSTNSATVPALGASSIKKSRKNSKMSELLKKETSQMTMGELAMTIPKGRRLIRHEKEEHVSADPFGRSQRLRSLSNDSTRVGFGGEGEAGGTALVAPQVEIIDGKMVIMESTVKYEDTVHYDENDEEAKERDSSNNLHADVERHHRTSASGRSSSSTSTCIPGKRWSKEETKQFYYCLSQVGPNFSMMATLFPSRKRKELKSKFKYEEKHHSNLIEIALKASTAPLDSEMFRVLHQMVDEDTKKNSTSTMENTQNHPQQQRKTHHSHIASSPMPMTPMSLGEYDEEYERGRKVSFDFNH